MAPTYSSGSEKNMQIPKNMQCDSEWGKNAKHLWNLNKRNKGVLCTIVATVFVFKFDITIKEGKKSHRMQLECLFSRLSSKHTRDNVY